MIKEKRILIVPLVYCAVSLDLDGFKHVLELLKK
jgi:hypothetical protein